MILEARARLPLQATQLDRALVEFVEFVERCLTPGTDGELAVALHEPGARGNLVLARAVPGDTTEFAIDRVPIVQALSAHEFLTAVASRKPKTTRSGVRSAALASPSATVLRELAGALDAKGRGVMLVVRLTGWTLRDGERTVAVDATFSHIRQGAKTLSAGVGIRFHALNVKDPVAAATVAESAHRMGLAFDKGIGTLPPDAARLRPPLASDADPRLRAPTAQERLLLVQTFDEALARAAEAIGAQSEDLADVELLFGRKGGFDKRLEDVMAGKREAVNLPSTVKRFMTEAFPQYRFEADDLRQLAFRYGIAPTLDLLVTFERIHHHGLGKAFTVHLAVDFPSTPFGGMLVGFGGTERSVFWLFHEGWERHEWAYTTRAELAQALEGCGSLLRRVLPAVEAECRALLLPAPDALARDVPVQGALSARDACRIVEPMAQTWAADAELQGVASAPTTGAPGYELASLGTDGQLRTGGAWQVVFLSKRLDRLCRYAVPYAGRVWWGFHRILEGAVPKYSASAPDDWVDSTVAAPQAVAAVQKQFGGRDPHELLLALRDPTRYSGQFIWEATCIGSGGSPDERRQVMVRLDRRTGAVLEVTAR